MNKEINLAQNIANLRKKNNVSQGQLAKAINVTPQAISKWENGVCQPETLTLPLLADYFNVSIDYLFYGCKETCDEIYEEITNLVASKPAHTEELFEVAMKLSSAAQHGIMYRLDIDTAKYDRNYHPMEVIGLPMHLLDVHGFSLCSPKGFSAIVTDDFFNTINGRTMKRASRIFGVLANEDCLRVITEILNFHGISWIELKEKTQFDEERLTNAIEIGKQAGLIEENDSPHAVLKAIYTIQRHHYNCLCLLLSTIKMIEISLLGATRVMNHTKLSMSFYEGSKTSSVDKTSQDQK